jgi:two-component system, cell cycle sensor histidine kinase and response regulator CckA
MYPPAPDRSLGIVALSDDPEITAQISHHLPTENVAFEAFTNPSEALAHTVRNSPDLLIVDVGVSSPSGRRLCHLLQSFTIQASQAPPLLILADSQDESKHSALIRATGAVALTTHPCEPETLETQIRYCLDPAHRPPARHLMVITPDEALTESLRSTLPASNWTIDACSDVVTVPHATSAPPPEVIIMDLQTTHALAAIEQWKNTRPAPTIIAIADAARTIPTWEALQAGALEYLPRSQDPANLAHTALSCHFHRLQADLETPSPDQAFDLQDAHSLLDTLLTESPYGQIVLNNRGFPVRWNPAAARLFRTLFDRRIEPHEPLRNLLAPLLANPNQLTVDAIAKGVSYDYEFSLTDAKDQRQWITLSVRPIRFRNNSIQGSHLTLRDTTVHHRKRTSTEQAREQLQALFDHSQDAIVLIDDVGAILDANPALMTLTGYEPTTFVGQILDTVLGAEGPPIFTPPVDDALPPAQSHGELRLRHAARHQIEVAYEYTRSIQPHVHMVILREITDRKALQRRLVNQLKMESVGRLASGVAHDLNNILTPIMMAPSMLRARVTDPTTLKLIKSIQEGAERGAVIVRQLLDFSRADVGEHQIIDLKQVVRTALDGLAESLPHHPRICFAETSQSYPVTGDPARLQVVIVHLMINAAESMNRGGEIRISLGVNEITSHELTHHPEARSGLYAQLTITDQGRGISNEHTHHVFDPFFTTKDFGDGAGMGLSVALGIVQAHGGFIKIRSNPGTGTAVSLSLPICPEQIPVLPRSHPDTHPSGDGRMIMIADPNELMATVLRTHLRNCGFRVTIAANSESAYAQLEALQNEVALLVIDLNLPKIQGETLVQRVARHYPELPLLAMTDRELDADEAITLSSSVSNVLLKPFNCDGLVNAIEEALFSRSAPAKSA